MYASKLLDPDENGIIRLLPRKLQNLKYIKLVKY
jgi:hypothetical protein